MTVLLTDDRSIFSEIMLSRQRMFGVVLASRREWLDTGFRVEFRIRDVNLAAICGEELGWQIAASQQEFPLLKKGDQVLLLSSDAVREGKLMAECWMCFT